MTTLTLDTSAMITLFKRVLPHVSKDTFVPMLGAIRLRVAGGHLVAQATDRYTAVESRMPLSEVDAATDLDVLVEGARVKSLLTALKANALTLLTVDDGRVTLGGADVTGPDGSFPAVSRLWPDRLADVVAGEVTLGAEHLAKLSAMATGVKDRRDMVVSLHRAQPDHGDLARTKPIVIMINDDSRVLLMPNRRDVPTDSDYQSWNI